MWQHGSVEGSDHPGPYGLGDGYEVDLALREIRHRGQPIAVDRQVFDVVAHLAANAHRVVPRTELLDEVWGDRFVSDSALSSRIKAARRALGDDGSRQDRILTVRGVGYRLLIDDEAPGPVEGSAPVTPGHRGDRGSGPMVDPLERGGIPLAWEELIGREAELGAAERLLEAGHPVTLVGPGGVGKTRLALDLARRQAERFADGARLIELAPVAGDDAVATAVAGVIGVRLPPGDDPTALVCRILRGRRLLLVLDNCEHVVAGALEFVTRLAGSCPTVALLVTSRAPIGFDGEHLVSVPPLATRSTVRPGAPAPSGEVLFLRRLAAAAPGSAPDRDLVAAICHRLDGIPLALELAAGRARTIGLADLHDRLDRVIGLLGANRLAPRHRTLRTTVGWSWDLLDGTQRRLLARASAFAGPFGLAAAEAVLADEEIGEDRVAGGLAALVDASLIQAVPDHGGGSGPGSGGLRYRLLEPIRQFAREAGDASDLAASRDRMLRHLVGWARSAGERLLVDDHPERWFRAIDGELDNLREAARLATLTGEVDAALDLTRSLREWAYLSVTDDPIAWATACLDRMEPDHPLHGQARSFAAYHAAPRGGRERLIAELEALDRPVDDPAADEPWLPRALTLLYWFTGRTEEAERACRRGIDHWAAIGDRANWAYAMCMLSWILDATDRDGARRAAEAALEAADELGSPLLRVNGLVGLVGTLAHDAPDEALAVSEEMVALARASGSRWNVATAVRIRSHLLSRAGRLDEADRSFEEALEVNGLGDRGEYLWYTLANLIEHLIRRGRHDDAGLALLAYHRTPAAIQDPLVAGGLARLRRRLERELEPARWTELEAEAAELPLVGLLERLAPRPLGTAS